MQAHIMLFDIDVIEIYGEDMVRLRTNDHRSSILISCGSALAAAEVGAALADAKVAAERKLAFRALEPIP